MADGFSAQMRDVGAVASLTLFVRGAARADAANNQITPCCARSKSGLLVLDL